MLKHAVHRGSIAFYRLEVPSLNSPEDIEEIINLNVEVVVEYFKVLDLNSLGGTEENSRKSVMANIVGRKMLYKRNLPMKATSVMV
jgi:hypothetical protein